MADETTPLTNTFVPQPPPGPVYVFPGGVSPRSRRHKMHQLQWCLGLTFLVIIIASLIIVLAINNEYPYPPVLLLATNESANNLNQTVNSTVLSERLEAIKFPIPDEPEDDWSLRRFHLQHNDTDWAISEGIKALGDREILEESLEPTPVDSPAFRHYRSLSSNAASRKLARRGFVENEATDSLAEKFNYTRGRVRSNIGHGPKIVLPDPTSDIICDFNAKYRRSSGICNNKNHPRHYGAALIPYRRMVNPDYADGISQPRGVLKNGTSLLPPARQVSLKINRASYETDSNFTVMLAVFGQFLDHDITATSLTSSLEGESINCCGQPLNLTHPECFPVTVLPDDPYYKAYNLSCMNFVRSAPAPTGHFGPRQQLNQATSFIDASVVYGNSDLRQNHLRTLNNGLLRMYITEDHRELLPISTNPDDGCNREVMIKQGKYCFESGDDRANENLLLTSMHLLWSRQHNYLANGLQKENPDWDDETVFQEARRIVAAQIAHITYNEFLPILLGREWADRKGITPQMENLDAPDTYDRNVNPSIANCFAAAAFRFAHTLLPGLFNVTSNHSNPEYMELHKMLFNPFSLWQSGGIDTALLIATNTPVQRVDRFFSLEVTQHLFEDISDDHLPACGLDLVSLNIQRGRDHGLPAYPVYRKHCQLPPVDTWEQMAQAVDKDSLKSIREIYSSPNDVDVYTGALSEPPLEGAIFGPLLACMVADQFMRLKRGDSFWYERKIGPQKFTKDQLRTIYGTTLSQIICRNSDDIKQIRKYVMEHRKNEPNVIIDCDDLKHFNFTPWNLNQQPVQLHKAQFNSQAARIRVINKSQTNKTNQSLNSIN
ncbi:myeloperoxidase isoform X1 [Lucilia sericata]|uniref:myeloperoxidase isoform X1 n=2 Tax=Lucilia sericata TaxID=13632 RepID=UPI0018A8738C|nr:myeloperoxidase isoform X1 [Lucilia sericata]